MDSHSLNVLEYDRVLALIAGQVQSPLGRKLVLALRPMRSLEQICRKHPLYADLFSLQETTLSLPSLCSEDLSEALQRVSPKDAVLSIEELLLCRAQLDAVRQLCRFRQNREMAELVSLSTLLQGFEPCDELSRRLHACLEEDGSVPDSASGELQMLRRQIRALQRKLQISLESLLKQPELEEAWQERLSLCATADMCCRCAARPKPCCPAWCMTSQTAAKPCSWNRPPAWLWAMNWPA
ncbi:MAG: hypothetical protein WCS95_08035 [Lentisphaeria bacterium]